MVLLEEGFISRMDCWIAAGTDVVGGLVVLSGFIYSGSTAIGSVWVEVVFGDALVIGSVLQDVSLRIRKATVGI